ncbi:MAG TPA: tetratricopeptide repeat protein [Candidatus Binatia bacterium]|jgi:TPR repeat protein|nr:tetratricopeptide repeat protein [Candidatus Binatia bacterium]
MTLSVLHHWFSRRNAPETVENQPRPSEAEAEFMNGVKFATGHGGVQDYAQAARWYGQAAERGHGLAQFNLAMMYGLGQGVLRDEAKSLMWMTRSAELGDAGAQYTLGVRRHLACRSGPRGMVSEGRIEALKWVRLSAAQGYRGAEGACEFVALGMSWEEVDEGGRRAAAFVAGKQHHRSA